MENPTSNSLSNIYRKNNNNVNSIINNNYTYNQKKEQTNDNKSIFNEILDDLIRKKTTKEDEIKNHIEKNKKILLEKFYSIANNDNTNKNFNITENKNLDKDQNLNNTNNKNFIPNNKIITEEGQKEYDEIREKYKNERTKQKSSIFKSEDLRISNTNSVHLKKGDFSPINPSIVNFENKNNIFIIQQKLFGENEVSEASKIENIDEINDLNLVNKNVKIENKTSPINNNMINFFDGKNVNFDMSSNLNETYYFQNETLLKERAIEYYYLSNKNSSTKKNSNSRDKNFSVQIASKLDYYTENNNNNFRRSNKTTNQVISEVNKFIQNLIPQSNNTTTINSSGRINNNININNISNYIHINNNNDAFNERNSFIKVKNNLNTNNDNKNKLLLNEEDYKRLSICRKYNLDKNNFIYITTNKIKKIKKKSTNNKIINIKNTIFSNRKKNSPITKRENKSGAIKDKLYLLHDFYSKLENLKNGCNSNNIKKITTKIPLSKNPSSTKSRKISKKKVINNIKNGNKLAVMKTLTKNNLIKFSKLNYKLEVINKIKQHSYSGLYFIYVEKTNEGFLFKGLYKRGPSEISNICNKIYGTPNTPLLLSYEKFFILIENNKKEFTLTKLDDIYNNYGKSILLIKND